MNSVHDVLKIERSIVLRAPRSRVWRALTDKQQFGSWFKATLTGDFEPGSRTAMVVHYPGYEHLQFPIYVQRKEPESLFSWRWIPGDAYAGNEADSPMTDVTFTLAELAEGTRLTVEETGFDAITLAKRAKAFEGNNQGWLIQLANIETYLRGQT